MVEVESTKLKVDVTALKIIKGFIYVGIGKNVQVFSMDGTRVHDGRHLMRRFCVHGIFACGQRVAFAGNRECVVGRLRDDGSVCVQSRHVHSDWILYVKLTHTEHIFLLGANNSLSSIHPCKPAVHCSYKSLLCCGLILGDDIDTCVVACGTMYKEVLIWTPAHHDTNGVLHRLTGHKGVILSLSYHETLQRLCSTSDDRTVKIWKVEYKDSFNSLSDKWMTAKIWNIFTIFGHMSKVWVARFIDDGRLITTGDDGQLRIWDKGGINHLSTQQGTAMRCFDVDEKSNRIVTGMKDGGLCVWPLAQTVFSQNTNVATIDSFMNKIRERIHSTDSSIDGHFLKTIRNEDETVPKRLVYLKSGILMMVTEHGRMYLYDCGWNYFFNDERFSSYCLLAVSPNRQLVCLASIEGVVLIFKEKAAKSILKIVDERISFGRIYSIHFVNDSSFVTCTDDGVLDLWTIISDGEYNLYQWNKFILPRCRERWLTAALLVNNRLVCGDRDGSVHVYNIRSIRNNEEAEKSFYRVHGRLGVSGMWLNESDGRIYSLGRDGFLRCWSFTNDEMSQLFADRLSVKWPIRIILVPNLGLLLIGFTKTDIEIWNLEEKRRLFSYNCGGGHRCWDFIFGDFSAEFCFVRQQALSLITFKFADFFHTTFIESGHRGETNSMQYWNEGWLVSGGEDTTIRFWDADHKLRGTLHSHLSSVKKIHLIPFGGEQFFASVGGRAQLMLWKVRVLTGGALEYIELASEMLKVQKKNNWRNAEYEVELEPRFMDVKLYTSSQSVLQIYVASSDASWRMYTYDLSCERLVTSLVIEQDNFCILSIVPFTWGSRSMVVTTRTDGIMVFWLLEDYKRARCLRKEVTHKSSIHCLDYAISGQTLLMLSVSDDSAVRMTAFEWVDHDIQLVSTWNNDYLHQAHVTGCKLINNFIVSAGCDQQVILWKWKYEENEFHVEPATQFRTDVADAHGVDYLIKSQLIRYLNDLANWNYNMRTIKLLKMQHKRLQASKY